MFDRLAYQRQWRASHREKVREYERKYRESHTASRRMLQQNWLRKNKEKVKQQRATWTSENWPAVRASQKRWQQKNKDKVKIIRRRYHAKRYGLTLAEYDALLAQKTCSVCRGRLKRPNLDHCHSTGRVRGALCTSCNLGIGLFKDDPQIVRMALAYLQK